MTNYFSDINILIIVVLKNLALFIIFYNGVYKNFEKKNLLLLAGRKKIEFGFVEKISDFIGIRYIEQTNIKKYIPGMTIKKFFLAMGIIFLVSQIIWMNITDSFSLSFLFSAFISSFPLMGLDVIRHMNHKKIRSDISKMLSVLNRWYSIKEDLLTAFEKTSQSDIREPLKTYVRDFVIQVNKGLDLNEAFFILERKVDSSFFRMFILNISQAVKNRGDISTLLLNLENEAYLLEQEYNRRKFKTANDRIIIYIVMLSILLIGYKIIFINQKTGNFYMETPVGKILISIYFIFYLIGFIISMGITKLNY